MPTKPLKLAERIKRRAGFIADAQAALEQARKSEKGYPADAVHAYRRARIAGNKPTRPRAKSWRG